MRPDFESITGQFPREVPVFPLPETVLFPGSLLPLHIFEPRYRRLVEDLLAGDGLLAIGLLDRCDPAEYEQTPPFLPTVCVGKLIHHEALPDGRSNIALLGISAGFAEPVESGRPYRVAEVELLADQLDLGQDLDHKLERAYRQTAQAPGGLDGLRVQLGQFLDTERLPAALINTCALTAPIFPRDKLGLLEERSLKRRLDRLIEFLERPWQWN
ncbi:MAG: LON peptidase substrate-binding domain-containing protein [Deltaproteobacteria bacterium]|nr:MAG: LON peptidase substrate-binding domain-containing protein [Deltaproteobacteria bacterium]